MNWSGQPSVVARFCFNCVRFFAQSLNEIYTFHSLPGCESLYLISKTSEKIMAKPKTICPQCGKQVSTPEKLAWHLSRECPALVNFVQAHAASREVVSTQQDARR
jgi:hypothetical protein